MRVSVFITTTTTTIIIIIMGDRHCLSNPFPWSSPRHPHTPSRPPTHPCPLHSSHQSLHKDALLHATARVISGGPIYVSDKPGQHDLALIRRLVLPNGTVLRGEVPGRPTRDCLLSDVQRDGTTALKVWNHGPVVGQLATFNVQGAAWSPQRREFVFHSPGESPPVVTSHLRPSDVEHRTFRESSPESSFVVRSSRTGEVRVLDRDQAWSIPLEPFTSEMLAISKRIEIAPTFDVAPLGLSHLLAPGFSVRRCEAVHRRGAPKGVDVAVVGGRGRGRGTGDGDGEETNEVDHEVLVWCSRAPSRVEVDGVEVTGWTRDDKTGVVSVPMPAASQEVEVEVEVEMEMEEHVVTLMA